MGVCGPGESSKEVKVYSQACLKHDVYSFLTSAKGGPWTTDEETRSAFIAATPAYSRDKFIKG